MIRSVGKTQSLQTIRGKASSSTQRGIRRRIPAGMTEKGLGVQKRKKTQRAVVCFVLLCFFPPPSAAASHPAQLSSKAAACCRVAQWGHGVLCASSRAMEKHLSMPSRPTTPTRGSSGHGHCRQDCWHTGAVVATSPVSLPARAARPLHKACHLPSSS